MMRFDGKTVVVTGGTSGIGKAAALRFAGEGARTVIIGRNETKGQKTAGEHDNIIYMQADLESAEECLRVSEQIINNIGSCDVLVNCAGIMNPGTIEELTVEKWDQVFDINVRATFLMSKYLLPLMRKAGGGHIVNIGSTAGTVGAWGLHAYSATKGAIIQLSKSMAAEYATENILVNCICPGGTITEIMDDNTEDNDSFAQRFPIKRLAQPEEIASAIAYIASDEASFFVGSTVLVDGGFTCI